MGPIWRPFAHLHEPGVLRLVRRDLRETHDANLLSPVLLDRVQLNAAAHAPRHRQVRGLVPWSERDLCQFSAGGVSMTHLVSCVSTLQTRMRNPAPMMPPVRSVRPPAPRLPGCAPCRRAPFQAVPGGPPSLTDSSTEPVRSNPSPAPDHATDQTGIVVGVRLMRQR